MTDPYDQHPELAAVYEELKVARARVVHLERALRTLYWCLASNDTDFAKLNSYSADYDPNYKPEYSPETMLARQALEPASIFGEEWPGGPRS